jgi:AcrR family transcriptional regulator
VSATEAGPVAAEVARTPRTPRSPRAREVVAAARAVLEAEGPEALTMRRLGEELGIRAPSLYKHVADKAAVEAALVEEALAETGTALHEAVAGAGPPGSRVVIEALLAAYRAEAVAHPHLYRLVTTGRLPREALPAGLEAWSGAPFGFAAAGDEHRARALWSLAHGMAILEVDGRYPDGADLDAMWHAAATAFSP